MINSNKFETAYDGFQNKIRRQILLKTGNTFIDEATGGIMPNDCVIIGAGTGIGKTEISKQVALHIVKSGPYGVALFSLESYRGELADKEKFQRIKQCLFERKRFDLLSKLQFRPWLCGHFLKTEVEEIEKSLIAPEIIKQSDSLTRIKIRYRENEGYNIKNFEKDIDQIVNDSGINIFIVDHLHYFDLHKKEENQAIKDIVNRIRDKSQIYKVPSIIFSHIRKKQGQFDNSIVPGIDEFHGTSEITKNPTVVITMSQAYDRVPKESHYSPTYFKIHKDRFEPTGKRYYALMNYNLNSGEYEKPYQLLKFSGGEMEELEPGKRPYWAKNVFWGWEKIEHHKPAKSRKPVKVKQKPLGNIKPKQSEIKLG